MADTMALDAELEAVRGLTTLERVLQWAFRRSPSAEVVDVVAQDEFTHDVIVRVAEAGYLVFDTS